MHLQQTIFLCLLFFVLLTCTETTRDLARDGINPAFDRNTIYLKNIYGNHFQNRDKKERNIPQNLENENFYLHIPLPSHQLHPTVNYEMQKFIPHHGRHWYHYHHQPPPTNPPPPPPTTAPPPEPCCQNTCQHADSACLQAASAMANSQAISHGGNAEASALAISNGNAQANAQAQAFSKAYNSGVSIPRNNVIVPRSNFDFVFPQN